MSDEQYIDKLGKLHLDKCMLAAFSHGEYFELGRKIGSLGFSVRKKAKNKPTTYQKDPQNRRREK